MRRLRRLGWWALFALIPLTLALIVFDDEAPLSETWHLVLLAAIVAVICVLAVGWAERNPQLMEREGADALVSYRPLPGTLEAMGAKPVAQEPLEARSRGLVFGYDPMAYPPVTHSRSDDAAEESPS